jgi:hypothetical protein
MTHVTGSPPSEVSTLPAPESASRLIVGRYHLGRIVGQGSSKIVYQAHDQYLGRDVAVAFVPGAKSDPEAHARLMGEVRALARLGDHPHIVTIHDIGDDEGEFFLVAEYLPGGSVAERLACETAGQLGGRAAISIARDVCRALERVHGEGLVHRDVKPDNIWLAGDGRALLGDFGVALSTRDGQGVSGQRVGTPGYMAPEQAHAGLADARSDLYALGVTLRKMLGGGGASDAELADLVYALVDERPERRPSSAEAVRRVLESRLESMTKPPRRPRLSRGSPGADHMPPPLPAALAGSERRPLIARERELAQLEHDWRAAAAGKRRFVILRGEPGIGKSRLAFHFAAHARRHGSSVLHGRCYEQAALPYQPLVDALRHVVAHGRAALPDDDVVELRLVLPELGGRTERRTTTRDAHLGPYRLFDAVARCLHRYAGRYPLVLVIDDLQWADRPTFQLLLHLIRQPAETGLLVVGTLQTPHPSLPDTVRAMVGDLLREGLLRRIDVTGLDADGIKTLVAASRRIEPSAQLVRMLADITDGNPLFVEQIVRDLRDRHRGEADGAPPPPGVKDVIGRRIARLSPASVDVLQTASVIGREFSLELLEIVLDTGGDAVILALEEAEAIGLVVGVPERLGSFAFCHGVVRDAVYDELPASTRARWHRRIAVVLERHSDASPAVLAQHAIQAGRRDFTERAARYSIQAAEQAGAAYAYGEAATHYERAINALQRLGHSHDRERGELLLALGRARWQGGLPGARQTTRSAAALARELDAPDLLARAAVGGRFYEIGVVDDRQRETLEEALERLPPSERGLRVKVMARLAEHLHLTDMTERSLAFSEQALTAARSQGDAELLLAALGARHVALLDFETGADRLRVSAELVELAMRTGHLDAAALARHWHIYDLMETGATDAARAEHVRLAALAKDLRQPLYRHAAMAWRCVWSQLAGRLDVAERLADEQQALAARARARDVQSNRLAQQFGVDWQRGRLPDLIGQLEHLAGRDGPHVTWSAALAFALADAGRRDDAGAILGDLSAGECASARPGLLRLTTLALLAETCARIGSQAQAAALRRRLLPYRSRFVQVGYMTSFGSVERLLGLLAAREGDAAASEHFARALERNSEIDADAMVEMTRRDREWALKEA